MFGRLFPDVHRSFSQRGSVLIELAIVFDFLLLVGLGAVQYGIALQDKQLMTQAARAAGRAASAIPPIVLPSEDQNRIIATVIRNTVRQFIIESNKSPADFEVSILPTTVSLSDGQVPAVQINVAKPRTKLYFGGVTLCVRNIVKLREGNTISEPSTEGGGELC